MLPNFLIVGAAKSGTTWMYEKLRRHPEVYMPRVKELGFFSSNATEDKTLDWYKYHFKRAPAVGEATPAYLHSPQAPRRIHNLIPEVKLIAILRHPTDRTYSHYWMYRGIDEVDSTFKEAIQESQRPCVKESLYGEQLDRYLSFFERDQLLILIAEEVFSHSSESLNRICSFLGVCGTFYQNQEWISDRVNRAARNRSRSIFEMITTVGTWMRHTKGARQVLDLLKATGITGLIKGANREPREYPQMDPELRKELDDEYATTIRRVEEILGREIQVWREK